MFSKIIVLSITLLCVACNTIETENPYTTINKIPLPSGFYRVVELENSYGKFLQHISLKKDKTVYKFNGELKGNQTAQFAVLDVSIGNKDLQQCADAVMRLRAEYLFAQKKFIQIDFIDNNLKHYKFYPPYTRTHFTTYLEQVFGMCGSASLAKQLNTVPNFRSIKIGDILIRGGFPGHALQVIDMAENNNAEKIYLLAQGFMPAQDIHVLVNVVDTDLSPWYKVNEKSIIQTPEYTFRSDELKMW